MSKDMILFNVTPLNTDVTDLKKFEEKAKKAKEAGATHLLVTEAEKSRWFWERDRTDPYPNWGMLYSSLFKIIVPEELAPWLPLDYAQRNLELVKARTEICRKYGLKGAACFTEPFYLPEEVYQAHPEFRGARCDHPRRARNDYFSPCIDNEAVRNMYREAMRKLCTVTDIDYVYIYTDDSGAGICWSDALYDGANGPDDCRYNPFGPRVLNFLRTFRDGAKEAGRDILVEISNHVGLKVRANLLDTVYPILDDNMATNYKTSKGIPLCSPADVNYEYTYAPVRSIPLVMQLLEQIEKGWKEPSRILRITVMDDDHDEQFRIIKAFLASPTDGFKSRVALLDRVAADIAGETAGPLLLDAWNQIEMGRKHFFDAYNEGLSWSCINQRLINRPFVLNPAALTEEEQSYYRPFQFQANDEAQAADLMNHQCTTFIRGHYAMFLSTRALGLAMDCMAAASKLYLRAAEIAKDKSELLKVGADRFQLLARFMRNYDDAIRFQEIVDTIDYEAQPEISPRLGTAADPRLTESERLIRLEVENTYAILHLIRSREREMLVLAPTVEQEDCFWLTTRIAEQLERKIKIMQAHRLDGKRLFVTRN